MTKAADAFAFGIMMWEVYMNKNAHAGTHSGAVVEAVVVRGERPPCDVSMPPQYSLLMQRCWDSDPALRPSFEQIITCLELLLDNLTSSDEEGLTVSEGSHEGRSSSRSSGSNTATGLVAQHVAAAAAAGNIAADYCAVVADRTAALVAPVSPTTVPAAGAAAAGGTGPAVPAAGKPLPAASTPRGSGVAEAVEQWLCGPDTPGSGFEIPRQQLQGLREWYAARPALQQGASSAEHEAYMLQEQAAVRSKLPWRLGSSRGGGWAARVVGSGSTGSSGQHQPSTPGPSWGASRHVRPSSEVSEYAA